MSKKSPSSPGYGLNTPAPVTQAQMREYQSLKEEAACIQEKLGALRQDLLARLQAGADVEAGALTARVRQQVVRLLTGPKLLPLLGTDKVEALRATVEPTVQTQLIVEQHKEAARNRKAAARQPVEPPGPAAVNLNPVEWNTQE